MTFQLASRIPPATASVLTVLLVTFAAPRAAAEEAALFAVVTHRDGLLSSLVHEHMAVARSPKIESRYDTPLFKDLPTWRFSAVIDARELLVDDPSLNKSWAERLRALRVIDDSEAFASVTAEQSAQIRETALGEDQLFVTKYPEIRAELNGIEATRFTVDGHDLPYRAKLVLTIRKRAVEKPIGVRIDRDQQNSIARITAIGRFRFSDFGIEPYSMAMGTIRVADEFHALGIFGIDISAPK